MTATAILGIDLVEAHVVQAAVPVNEAIVALESKLADVAEVAVVDGTNTVSAETVREAICLSLVAGSPAPSAGFDLVLPANKGPVIVRNVAGHTATVNVSGDASTVAVSNGAAALLYCDGVTLYNVAGGSSSGATAFTGLTDAPSSYSGTAGSVPRVNDAETGLELVSPGALPLSINAQTGTSYAFVLADAGKLVTLANAAAINVLVPANASVAFPIGTQILVAQKGAGQVTLVADTGVTIETPETLKTRKQHAQLALVKTATNTWTVDGNLEASA